MRRSRDMSTLIGKQSPHLPILCVQSVLLQSHAVHLFLHLSHLSGRPKIGLWLTRLGSKFTLATGP